MSMLTVWRNKLRKARDKKLREIRAERRGRQAGEKAAAGAKKEKKK